jgi:transcriptional regulator with XRE-family HTH domain
MNFPMNLKRLRLERGLTQAALAAQCGLAQPHIAAMEQGQRQPGLPTLQRIAEALGCGPADLLSERDSGLDRFALDALCNALARGGPRPKDLAEPFWSDLQVSFRPKLLALVPGVPRPRLRISARAAERRIRARLGSEGFDEVARRLEKAYTP